MRQLVIFATLLPLLLPIAARADLQQELMQVTEHLLMDGAGQLPAGGVVNQPEIIADFYAGNDYQPAWQDREQVRGILDLLGAAAADGLNPADYHYPTLQTLWQRQYEAWENRDRLRARFDVLLSDGLILFIRHLLQGKVDPKQLDPAFNYDRLDFEPGRVSDSLRTAIATGSVFDLVERARPRQNFYLQMKAALAYFRELAAAETFVAVADDVVLKPGQSHANVVPLRQRLTRLGYLSAEAPAGSTVYDDALESAVRRFQRDHGIDVDGIIGRQSYAFLNMTWDQRVDSLRVNMDRLRWISRETAEDAIIVNIAGFELYYLRDGELLWETPVMTGTIEHQTPIFTARLKYLEFNPIWTVPRSIIRRSLFPAFRANPQYAIDNRYHLYDRSGRQVDPRDLDWSAYSPDNFPFRVVQQPWANNALGRVKFIFPNRHAIYLHDTPAKALFSRSSRAFSSGCVRVQNPFAFAEVLLNDPDNWSLEQINALVDSREPQYRVYLQRDVDVMLMYWTTSPTRGGKLQFHADIYGKDAAALAALNAPPGRE